MASREQTRCHQGERTPTAPADGRMPAGPRRYRGDLREPERSEFSRDDLVDVLLRELEVARVRALKRLDRVGSQQDDLDIGVVSMGLLGLVVGQ